MASDSTFLRLTPANSLAMQAFNDIAILLEENGDTGDHRLPEQVREPMFIRPYSAQRYDHDQYMSLDGSFKSTGSGDDTTVVGAESTETETDSENQSSNNPPLKFEGHYDVQFDSKQSMRGVGWVLGVGRWKNESKRPTGGVDLLLAPPKSSFQKYELAGRHARLFFDKNGSLTLAAASDREPIIVLGNEEFCSGQRIITERSNRVSFGRLSYSLDFVIEDESVYQQQLKRFLNNVFGQMAPPPDLSATPSPFDFVLGQWLIRGTVGKGTFGTVSAAKHKITGEGAAAKFFTRTAQNESTIRAEIELLQNLPKHPQILQFCEVMYERQNAWFSGIRDENDERYAFRARPERVVIIYAPFARGNLVEYFPRLNDVTRLMAFHQVLSGISALHSSGYIHRDIKPANLAVLSHSEDNINTVILDYGQTTSERLCNAKRGSVGTISYLAPEMEMERMRYDNAVDVWACGIVGLQLFVTDGKLKWHHILTDQSPYERMAAGLRGCPKGSVQSLLMKMLAYESSERISAEKALEHECFASVKIKAAEVTRPTLGHKRGRSLGI